MITYVINDIEYVSIRQFIALIGRSAQQSTRRLIDAGNSVRRLKQLRDGVHIMIPLSEVRGFPFVNRGKQINGKDIYHFFPFQRQSDGTEKPFEGTLHEAATLTDPGNTDSEIVWRKCFCEECTYTLEHCKARQEADSLIIEEEK